MINLKTMSMNQGPAPGTLRVVPLSQQLPVPSTSLCKLRLSPAGTDSSAEPSTGGSDPVRVEEPEVPSL